MLLAAVVLTTGCYRLPRGKAPQMDMVFNRFDEIKIGQSTSTEVLSFIQDKSLDELLSQDEQTIVSWGQNGTGAVIWLNAVTFDDISNTAARKYAMLVNEDSPGWGVLYGKKSRKLRAEFEYTLPPEFDELEFTNENEKRREAVKTALSLFLKDTNVVRYDSDYIYTSAMMLRQTFNDMLYQAERVPANFSTIDSPAGMAFVHPTMGNGRIRMLLDNKTYAVRLKIKIGSSVKSFAKDQDVIAMDATSTTQDGVTSFLPTQAQRPQPEAAAPTTQRRSIWDRFRAKPRQYTPEELSEIEAMAQQKADRDIAEMNKQVDTAVEESEADGDKPADVEIYETAPVRPQQPELPAMQEESYLPTIPEQPDQPGQIGLPINP